MVDTDLILAGVGASGASGASLGWIGPQGATAPTSAVSALNAAFRDLGLLTGDGIENARSETTTNIDAYGLTTVARKLVTETDTTLQLTMLESNPVSLAVYHRLALDALTPAATTGALDFTEGAARSRRYAFVLDMVDGDNRIRGYAPLVEVTDRGSLLFRKAAVVGYPVTLTAYTGPDGVAIHWFYQIPALAP